MSSFDTAWDSIVKAPIYDEHNQIIDADAIYSGGDKSDEGAIRYATEDPTQALAYALFGSAVGELPRWVDGSNPPSPLWEEEYGEIPDHVLNRVPMRRTIPSMWKTPNAPDKDVYVMSDRGGNSDSYVFQEGHEPTERMSDEEVKQLIVGMLDEMTSKPHSPKSPRGFGYHAAETSADEYLPNEQVQHMKEALQRLDGTLPSTPNYLTAQMMPYLATAWRDQFKEMVHDLKEVGQFDYDELSGVEQDTYDWLNRIGAL